MVEEYDNCIGKRNNSLAQYMGIPDDEIAVADLAEWKRHWIGMPEFDNAPLKEVYKTLQVKFESEEDYKAFAELVGCKLTEKTKQIWYPQREKDNLSLVRWMED